MSVDPMVKNFCDLMADKGRVEMLPAVAADYKVMMDAVSGVISGELITVSELNEERKSAIQANLEKQAGKSWNSLSLLTRKSLAVSFSKLGTRLWTPASRLSCRF